MCYDRRSYYEHKKTVASQSKEQADKRSELVGNLLKDAEKAGEKAKPDAAPAKEAVPAK
jgi:hypothetical protein